MTLLADTGPLYALAAPSDQYHERALREMRKIRAENHAILVAFSTVCETYSLLLRRSNPSAVQSWQQRLRKRAGFIAPTREDYLEATAKVAAYSDQALSPFDGVAAVLGERLGLAIWTFDADFDVMGAEVWR